MRVPLRRMRSTAGAVLSSWQKRSRKEVEARIADSGVRRSCASTAISISLAFSSRCVVASCSASCCFCRASCTKTSTLAARMLASSGL